MTFWIEHDDILVRKVEIQASEKSGEILRAVDD